MRIPTKSVVVFGSILLAFWLLMMNFYAKLDLGGQIFNKRFLFSLAIASFSIAVAFVAPDFKSSVYAFGITFGLLLFLSLGLGFVFGDSGMLDASTGGSFDANDSAYAVFDANLFTDWGKNAILLASALEIIIPIALVTFGIILVVYGATADALAETLIEFAVIIGGLIIYAQLIKPAFA